MQVHTEQLAALCTDLPGHADSFGPEEGRVLEPVVFIAAEMPTS